MTRVLITGMSGAGKSAAIRELNARGYRAVDLDAPDWSRWIDADPVDALTPAAGKDWVWRIDKVRALLADATADVLFVSGCAGNMVEAYPLIDSVVLLSPGLAVTMARLESRPPGEYGSTPEERETVAELVREVEPLLRRRADYEIDSGGAIERTVDDLLRLHGLPMAARGAAS